MGLDRRIKNKEYYAVVSGRVDEPTIFSSWGDAHPRVTGYPAVHKAFFTIKEAREYMESKEISEFKEIIKSTALDTTPVRGSTVYYVVAHGAKPGIRAVWCGLLGALEEINEISGACHKRFRTEAQAEAFIEDWKESYAEVLLRAVKEGLDRGLRPRDMKLSVKGLLHGGEEPIENLAEQLRSTNLG